MKDRNYAAMSPLLQINEYTSPGDFIYGDADGVVEIEHGRLGNAALIEKGVESTLISAPGQNHGTIVGWSIDHEIDFIVQSILKAPAINLEFCLKRMTIGK